MSWRYQRWIAVGALAGLLWGWVSAMYLPRLVAYGIDLGVAVGCAAVMLAIWRDIQGIKRKLDEDKRQLDERLAELEQRREELQRKINAPWN